MSGKPEPGDADLVHGEDPVRDAEPGHRVGDAVAAEHRDLALGEERDAVRVHAGHALARVEHTAGRGTPRVAAGRDAEDVTRADLDAERALGGLELGACDDRRVGQRRTAVRGHHVEQHTTPDDTVGERHDRVAARTVAAHVRRGPPVVHLAAHEHVAQRVDVRDAEPVHLRADVVAARLVARGCPCSHGCRPRRACGAAPGTGTPASGRRRDREQG